MKLVGSIVAAMHSADSLTKDRRNQTPQHNKAVHEALQSLTWVMYSGPNCGRSLVNNASLKISEGLRLFKCLIYKLHSLRWSVKLKPVEDARRFPFLAG